MSDSLTDSLSRFTPDGSGLDRDALLFAAGKASARPNRAWAALSAILASSQVLTLALLLHRPMDVPAPLSMAASLPQPVAVDPSPLPRASLGVLVRNAFRMDEPDLPPTELLNSLASTDPPLRASAMKTPAGLD